MRPTTVTSLSVVWIPILAQNKRKTPRSPFAAVYDFQFIIFKELYCNTITLCKPKKKTKISSTTHEYY